MILDQEAIKEELAKDQELGDSEAENAEDQQTEGEQEEEIQFTADEQRAHGRGWRPKDEYNGDPDEWRTAKQFNEHGELIGRVRQQNDQMQHMSKNFDERITGLNIMHKGQLENQMKQLNTQFNDAVEAGETDKAADIRDQQVSVSSQIDRASTVPAAQPNNDKAVQAQWELDNAWIHSNTDKANVAKGTFTSALNMGKSISEALEMVESAVIPYSQAPSNRNRANPSSVTSGNSSSRDKKGRSLSMADVSHTENQMRGMFKDDKSFLKAVQDSRVGP